MPDGSMRYCNMANGGPLFVYVKDGKIIRTTPIESRGRRSAAVDDQGTRPQVHPAAQDDARPPRPERKSIVYSPDRLLHPMKRVDFDPNGERNVDNRGKSGYVRISWEEALDLVASEIKRLKRTHGPGVMTVSHGSHHTWGNIGYYLSALYRFRNAVGYTQIHHNPDSWEGWYWGAVHHWGHTLRVGQSETYGTVEDCLKHCDMIVFWAADPETTAGSYGAQEGTVRRQWLKNPKLGIKVVHVDPYYNASAQFLPGKWLAPRPTTRSPWPWRSPTSGSRRGSTTKIMCAPTPSVSTSGRRISSARRTARRRRRNGRRRRPAFRQRTCARSRARRDESASTSRPAAGATATAVRAATRPVSSGHG